VVDIDRETGIRRRHHLHESVIQRAMKDAVRKVGVAKPARLPRPTGGRPQWTYYRVTGTLNFPD